MIVGPLWSVETVFGVLGIRRGVIDVLCVALGDGFGVLGWRMVSSDMTIFFRKWSHRLCHSSGVLAECFWGLVGSFGRAAVPWVAFGS